MINNSIAIMAAIIFYITVAILLTVHVFGASSLFRSSSDNISEGLDHKNSCQEASRKTVAIERATVTLSSSDSIFGTWVSENCETRSGPEFLLRSYIFHPNNSFKLVQHYYEDNSCGTPTYTVVAHGKLSEAEVESHRYYSLHTVSVIPHHPDAADQLAMKLNMTTCAGLAKKIKPSKEYYLLNDPENKGHIFKHFYLDCPKVKKRYASRRILKRTFNCISALNLDFNELVYYKVRIKPAVDDDMRVTHFRQELLLGELHSEYKCRQFVAPTSYQVPLLRIDSSVSKTLGIELSEFMRRDSLLNIDLNSMMQVGGRARQKIFLGNFDIARIEDLDDIKSSKILGREEDEIVENEPIPEPNILHICHVCSSIANANERNPPILFQLSFPLQLGGEWVSMNCESKPFRNMKPRYLTRHYRFYSGDNTFIVESKFFFDSACSSLSYSITSAGHYKTATPNTYVPGGTAVNFYLEKASVTIFDAHLVEDLDSYACGIATWKLGVPMKLPNNEACGQLGFLVPSIEYELLKTGVEEDSLLLFTGQADTGILGRQSYNRPTAYQLPLVKCNDLPPYSESLKEILSSPLYSDDEYSNIYDFKALAMDFADSGALHTKTSASILVISFIFMYLSNSS